MSEFNPYEPPKVESRVDLPSLDGEPSRLRIIDGSLVVPKNGRLPDICIYTGNVGGNDPIDRKFYWAPRWIYILFLLNIIIVLIVYMIVRKSGKVVYYVSPEARANRLKLIIINWLIFLSGFGFLGAAIALDIGMISWGFLVMLLISLIVYFTKIQGIMPSRIDEHYVYLKGIKPEIMRAIADTSRGLKKGSLNDDPFDLELL